MIASQALVNIGMTMGIMPITGLTLPFVSFGGSSLLTSFLAAAIMINVNQRRPVILAKKPFEFGDEDD
ncbi:MAG: FtsW/RodA/SpoVE family cell cycle protein, partial [Phycisphaerales bacterium]